VRADDDLAGGEREPALALVGSAATGAVVHGSFPFVVIERRLGYALQALQALLGWPGA
jgi:hypothetical protein